MPQPSPTPVQIKGSAARRSPLHVPGASRVPLPEIKLEAEDTETGRRQHDCSHRWPDAAIYCLGEEEPARSDSRAKLESEQTDPKGQ